MTNLNCYKELGYFLFHLQYHIYYVDPIIIFDHYSVPAQSCHSIFLLIGKTNQALSLNSLAY